jgi:hypothetical protein
MAAHSTTSAEISTITTSQAMAVNTVLEHPIVSNRIPQLWSWLLLLIRQLTDLMELNNYLQGSYGASHDKLLQWETKHVGPPDEGHWEATAISKHIE